MQCPSCKEQIDDDSRYCDHCGEQILICSECGRPGRGKCCIFDGKELVPAGSCVPQAPANPAPAGTVTPTPAVQPAARSGITGADDKIKLTSQMYGIMIEARDGDIIGNKKGPFAGVFGRFKYISGTHCKIVRTAAGWHIQDTGSSGTGSTNGTFYNGIRLEPNRIYPIASNTTVKIADIELLITYSTAEGGTVRI